MKDIHARVESIAKIHNAKTYIKTMFGSSLPPVVCRMNDVLFTLVVFVCEVVFNTYCVVFLFCISSSCVYPLLPVSLDCPFWISLSIFFNDVYLMKTQIRVNYIFL
jgi:hypothetical protein